ncbi:MAG: cache domain-containing protein [Sulfuricurvum sp.]|uniref:PDC sensor domain-containing protein n=1 Tax=Sulfuricurvum sp. TaxID=2025608 RepID=UPI002627618A|nr:cache domain-containing protein [Sulfuricurvum sp.]MDD2830191.1 cache domain-containing protein [Sulfuricurvum sp.]MDD4949557.1 cache domain-containing protein [Sulfuricurvum sp.]
MDSIKYIEIFPFIENSVRLFDDQNRFLKKIILTGKICALEKAANLFSFTEKTIDTFSDLKEELIPLLINENLKKYTEELRSKGQISIDVLIRNLFERTADVGFLATDTSIIQYLNNEVTSEYLRKRLIEYTLKYSVYNEIIITDTQGNIKLTLHDSTQITTTSDPIIQSALKSDGYSEQYAHTDLFPSQKKTLLFAQKIIDNTKSIGVLVLCFRFDDEMERIFSSLLNPGEHIFFTDGKEVITSSSHEASNMKKEYYKIAQDDETTYRDGNLFISAKSKGYEGYFGAPWRSVAFINVKKITQKPPHQDSVSEKCTLNENIKSIIRKADDVIEDLSDVIINGELIASKERVYVLTPVLDNLRNVSTSILSTIKDTVSNLENTMMEGLIFDVEASSKLAIEIMDRNLYERANDCRWWAMTPAFEEELTSLTPDVNRLTEVLHYINSLYTVYTNLFIFDRNGTIIASSNDSTVVGKNVSGEYISKTINNTTTQNYFVSPFENTSFYDDTATYIYSATVRHNSKSLGGIGIVFDAYPQFQAMLKDSFPLEKVGFSAFIDRKGVVISTTHPDNSPMDIVELDEEILRFNAKETTHRFTTYRGKKYLLGIALSQGYREYKISDNYKNDILALTFIEY